MSPMSAYFGRLAVEEAAIHTIIAVMFTLSFANVLTDLVQAHSTKQRIVAELKGALLNAIFAGRRSQKITLTASTTELQIVASGRVLQN